MLKQLDKSDPVTKVVGLILGTPEFRRKGRFRKAEVMNRRYFLKSGSIALASVGMSLSAPSFLERVVLGNALTGRQAKDPDRDLSTRRGRRAQHGGPVW